MMMILPVTWMFSLFMLVKLEQYSQFGQRRDPERYPGFGHVRGLWLKVL